MEIEKCEAYETFSSTALAPSPKQMATLLCFLRPLSTGKIHISSGVQMKDLFKNHSEDWSDTMVISSWPKTLPNTVG